MTIELSKTQREALQSGAAHDEGHITLPSTLRGGARQKVLTSLVTAKLAGYRFGALVITPDGIAALGKTDAAEGPVVDDALPGDEVTAQADDSDAADGELADEAPALATAEVTIYAGEMEPSVETNEPATTAPVEPEDRAEVPQVTIEPAEAAPTESAQPTKQPRTGTKQAKLIEMLKRPQGATIAEVVAALQWEPHTVRGAIAGALKKKLGLKIESEKEGVRGRVYRVDE